MWDDLVFYLYSIFKENNRMENQPSLKELENVLQNRFPDEEASFPMEDFRKSLGAVKRTAEILGNHKGPIVRYMMNEYHMQPESITLDDIEKVYQSHGPVKEQTDNQKRVEKSIIDRQGKDAELRGHIQEMMRTMHSTDRAYRILDNWADYLTLNAMHFNGSKCILDIAEVAENNGGVVNAENDPMKAADRPLRERLRFLHEKLLTIGKNVGADTDEFKEFRDKLQAAADGGSLDELKTAARDYSARKNPWSQRGKDRKAIADRVTELLDLAIPLRKDILDAGENAKAAFEKRWIAENPVGEKRNEAGNGGVAETRKVRKKEEENRILSAPQSSDEEFREVAAGRMAEYIIDKNITRNRTDVRYKDETMKRLTEKLTEKLKGVSPEELRSVFNERAKGNKIDSGIEALADRYFPKNDQVRLLEEREDLRHQYSDTVKNQLSFYRPVNGKIGVPAGKYDTASMIHDNLVPLMMRKALAKMDPKEKEYLRVDSEAFEALQANIRERFFPENKACTKDYYQALERMDGTKILEHLNAEKLPDELENLKTAQLMKAAVSAGANKAKTAAQPGNIGEAVQKGEERLKTLKVNDQFKDCLRELKIPMTPAKETLFQVAYEFEKDDVLKNNVHELMHWVKNAAAEKKDKGQAGKEKLDQIKQGLTYVENRGREFLEGNAAKCSIYVDGVANSPDAGKFASEWPKANQLAECYRRVFSGPIPVKASPEKENQIKAVLNASEKLKNRMQSLQSPAKAPADPKVNPPVKSGKVPGLGN